MSDIVVGMGQIGTAVKAVTESEYSFDSSQNSGLPIGIHGDIEVMHVCFPYSDDFVGAVKEYTELVQPKHTIVWSTVPIGTCEKLGVVHTPVEGKHPDLELSIRQMERWIGTDNEEEGKFFSGYFTALGLRTKVVNSSRFTEALKLMSTTEYGLNIEFARYKKQVADAIEMDFELTKEWNQAYNRLYKNLGMDGRFQKFVLDAPEGEKGGHCITPNARLLFEQYPDDLVAKVAEL